MRKWILVFTAVLLALCLGCAKPNEAPPDAAANDGGTDATVTAEPPPSDTPNVTAPPTPTPMPDMSLSSTGIVDGAMGLPYGAKGEQVRRNVPTLSLPLTVSYVPEGTAALALTMIDPDGGNWVHWTACNIPVDGASCDIAENASVDWAAPVVQGRNDFGAPGYGGPTPPSGVHTYVITVYALSEPLALEAGFRLNALQSAMEGKILGEAVLTGTYAR